MSANDDDPVAAIKDLSEKYVEISRGIISITAKLEVMKDFRGEGRDKILEELGQLSIRISALDNKTSTIPLLHRDVLTAKTDIGNIQKTIHTLQNILVEYGRKHVGYDVELSTLQKLVDELRTRGGELEKEHSKKCIENMACRVSTKEFKDRLDTYIEDEVKPKLIKVDRIWWTALALNAILATCIGVMTLIILFRRTGSPITVNQPDVSALVNLIETDVLEHLKSSGEQFIPSDVSWMHAPTCMCSMCIIHRTPDSP